MTAVRVRAASPAGALGNRVSLLGDSITSGSLSAHVSRNDKDLLNWVSIFTNSKARFTGNAGVSGNTSAQMLARIQTDIITPGCDVCIVLAGTNDAATGVTVATYAANMTAIAAALVAAGIKPVFCTITPQPATSARRRLWDSYNTWLTVFCHRNGIPLVPVSQRTTDATTGGYIAAYDGGDGIHPTAAGAKVIGQAMADTVSPLLGTLAPPVAVFQTADAINMIPGGLFLVDTNADGVADGWGKTGASAVASIVTDASILGNWQRLTDPANEFAQVALSSAITTGFAVGDRLAFSGRYRSDVAGNTANLNLGWTGSGITSRPIGTFTLTCPDHLFYMEEVVPASTTAISISMTIQSASSLDVRMAQMQLVNLTSLGIA